MLVVTWPWSGPTAWRRARGRCSSSSGCDHEVRLIFFIFSSFLWLLSYHVKGQYIQRAAWFTWCFQFSRELANFCINFELYFHQEGVLCLFFRQTFHLELVLVIFRSKILFDCIFINMHPPFLKPFSIMKQKFNATEFTCLLKTCSSFYSSVAHPIYLVIWSSLLQWMNRCFFLLPYAHESSYKIVYILYSRWLILSFNR